jgi:phosphatidylglycerol:prolipoprotein diacylglycerol transferase
MLLPRLLYSLFMVLALAAFLLIRHFIPKPAGLQVLPAWKRWALAMAGFIGGALGAKLPFALSSAEGWQSSTAWLSDGKTITTALAMAYLMVELTKLVLGIRVKTGDTFALPLAVALAIGRWGCFFNGCCYGSATDLPWGVDFGDGVRRHPTQIYESGFHLGMAALLLQCLRYGLFRCQQLKLYLIAYGIYRFATEFIRPEPVWWLGLTFYQWVAVGLVVALSIQWLVDARSSAVPRAAPSLPASGAA